MHNITPLTLLDSLSLWNNKSKPVISLFGNKSFELTALSVEFFETYLAFKSTALTDVLALQLF